MVFPPTFCVLCLPAAHGCQDRLYFLGRKGTARSVDHGPRFASPLLRLPSFLLPSTPVCLLPFSRKGGVGSHLAPEQSFPEQLRHDRQVNCDRGGSLGFPFCVFGRAILVRTTTPLALEARALLGEQAGGGWQALQASQAQARPAHPAGQATGQPAEPGEPDRGRASPARESTL